VPTLTKQTAARAAVRARASTASSMNTKSRALAPVATDHRGLRALRRGAERGHHPPSARWAGAVDGRDRECGELDVGATRGTARAGDDGAGEHTGQAHGVQDVALLTGTSRAGTAPYSWPAGRATITFAPMAAAAPRDGDDALQVRAHRRRCDPPREHQRQVVDTSARRSATSSANSRGVHRHRVDRQLATAAPHLGQVGQAARGRSSTTSTAWVSATSRFDEVRADETRLRRRRDPHAVAGSGRRSSCTRSPGATSPSAPRTTRRTSLRPPMRTHDHGVFPTARRRRSPGEHHGAEPQATLLDRRRGGDDAVDDVGVSGEPGARGDADAAVVHPPAGEDVGCLEVQLRRPCRSVVAGAEANSRPSAAIAGTSRGSMDTGHQHDALQRGGFEGCTSGVDQVARRGAAAGFSTKRSTRPSAANAPRRRRRGRRRR